MNKKLLIALPLCVIGYHGTTQVTAQANCQPVEVQSACSGGGRININNNSKNVSPSNLCARPGESIEVIVTPSNTTATVSGKTGSWPYGSGSSFLINAPVDGNYDYNVIFEDGTCIDPRITVKG
jgi:hypothetical protein